MYPTVNITPIYVYLSLESVDGRAESDLHNPCDDLMALIRSAGLEPWRSPELCHITMRWGEVISTLCNLEAFRRLTKRRQRQRRRHVHNHGKSRHLRGLSIVQHQDTTMLSLLRSFGSSMWMLFLIIRPVFRNVQSDFVTVCFLKPTARACRWDQVRELHITRWRGTD